MPGTATKKGPGAPFLHVAVGVITRQGRVLLSHRASHQHQGDKWEFPGGKLEPGESTLAALKRELFEELSIELHQAKPLMEVHHQYPERDVLLDIWLVESFSGEPKGMEGQQVAWFAVSELAALRFPDANLPIVERVRQLLSAP
ncbi:8-oxo-dGTP diphosphatase MutT [Alkalimonas sp. NCh-2]|uniref:8-oxo-dGTP diphosphatase MutT n=1 Tax=Alkalimonas sp. NCh-2 TaxID=3144846 RepID=UPI0031F706DD